MVECKCFFCLGDPPGAHFEGECVETPVPLLKCLRTHYRRHCKPFSGQKIHCIWVKSQTIFRGDTPGLPQQEARRAALSQAPPALGSRHQFPLGSPAFPLVLFYETTTGSAPQFLISLGVFGKHVLSISIRYSICRKVESCYLVTPVSSLIDIICLLFLFELSWQTNKFGKKIRQILTNKSFKVTFREVFTHDCILCVYWTLLRHLQLHGESILYESAKPLSFFRLLIFHLFNFDNEHRSTWFVLRLNYGQRGTQQKGLLFSVMKT